MTDILWEAMRLVAAIKLSGPENEMEEMLVAVVDELNRREVSPSLDEALNSGNGTYKS